MGRKKNYGRSASRENADHDCKKSPELAVTIKQSIDKEELTVDPAVLHVTEKSTVASENPVLEADGEVVATVDKPDEETDVNHTIKTEEQVPVPEEATGEAIKTIEYEAKKAEETAAEKAEEEKLVAKGWADQVNEIAAEMALEEGSARKAEYTVNQATEEVPNSENNRSEEVGFVVALDETATNPTVIQKLGIIEDEYSKEGSANCKDKDVDSAAQVPSPLMPTVTPSKTKPPPLKPCLIKKQECAASPDPKNHHLNSSEGDSGEETDEAGSGVAAVVKKKVVTFLSPYRSPQQRSTMLGELAKGGDTALGFDTSDGGDGDISGDVQPGAKAHSLFGKALNACFPSDDTQPHLQQSLTMQQLLPPVIPRVLGIYGLRVILVWLLKRLVFSKLSATKGAGTAAIGAKALQHALLILSLLNAGVSAAFGLMQTKPFEKLETATQTNAANNGKTAEETYNQVPTFDTKRQLRKYNTLMRMTRQVVYMIFGYIIHDLLTILPDWKNVGADLVHHLVGIGVSISILRRPLTMLPMVAPITHLEVSTVPLNLMWILKDITKMMTADGSNGGAPPAAGLITAVLRKLTLANQILFAGAFFWYRVGWYPLFFWKVRAKQPQVWEQTIGNSGKKLLVAQYGLHVYWFSIVLRKLIASLSTAPTK